jgi:hypothetical protein
MGEYFKDNSSYRLLRESIRKPKVKGAGFRNGSNGFPGGDLV